MLHSVSSATSPFTAADLHSLCNGRLTLASLTPVTITDQSAKSTLYFTPFLGNRVGLYDTTSNAWVIYPFSEISKAISGLTSGKNYDVFLYNNSGTLTLELSAAWTNDTTRADALTLQDGTYVKNADKARRWLGTIRTTGTTTTEDSVTKRLVMNAYNKVLRGLFTCPGYSDNNSAGNYTTTSTTWVAANGGTGSKVEFLSDGLNAVNTFAGFTATNGTGVQTNGGIGIDSTTQATPSATQSQANATYIQCYSCAYEATLAEGYHHLNMLVSLPVAGTATYYCDYQRLGGTVDSYLTYMTARIMA